MSVKANFKKALVKTKSGLVKGCFSEGVYVYKGIPYALPPIGNLRWKPPVKMKDWTGVRSALHFGSEAIQDIDYDPETDQYGIASGASYSEDCLYLNVYSPAETENDKLPVLFWIHGGGFNSGAGSQSLYPGEQLAGKGRMIVVTINYRLGIFGFFSHPWLDKEQNGFSGNYGLMDQALALRWVSENIEAFGGDKERICIAGQSAGSVSVGLMLFQEDAAGLYNRAIMQSGPILDMNLPVLSKPEAQGYAKDFTELVKAHSLCELRDMDAWSVAEAEKIIKEQRGAYCFRPDIDGRILKDKPSVLIDRKEYQKVDLLCGATADEFGVPVTNPTKVESWNHFVNDSMIYEALKMAELLSTGTDSKVYCYYYTRKDKVYNLAPHSAELPYLFGRRGYGGIMPWRKYDWDKDDAAFSEKIMQMWSSFVYGNAPDSNWKVYHGHEIMELGKDIHPLGSELTDRMKIQEEIVKRGSVSKFNLA